ncbi:NAD-binding protein [Fomitiporia mediterranea MF3/22]|uniref:NAD-binding protein n=1 Tax=Fomitiporia mediterranea (strain MF3/22) TaxID=694068 RepID=UPI0004407BBE|nr:NAD-binding protein [Fomitiporia mediterranea MF3/22]EJD02677.1 NAD-binding protein [Fomitiporia mediterranea MF3/22]
MAGSAEIQRAFLSAKRFAVIGASKNPDKWGSRVLRWYQTHDKTVTPVHPREIELEGLKTFETLEAVPEPSETAVSVITPPAVTLGILESAKSLNVPYVWLQPGAENDEVRKYVESAGLTDRVVLGGPCVLRDGPAILRNLGEESKL